MSRALLLGAGGTLAPAVPSDPVAGYSIWLKADSLALSDNAAVASWVDSSANAYNFVQAVEASKPIYKTAIVNSRPILRFDGSDDTLRRAGAGPVTGQTGSVFAVAAIDVTTSTERFVLTGNNSALDGFVRLGKANDDLRTEFLDSALIDRINGLTTMIAGTFYVMEWHCDGSGYSFVLNGTTLAESVSQGAQNGHWWSDFGGGLAAVCIGSSHEASGWWDGDIAEILNYNTELSSGNKALTRQYLGGKYNITVV